MIRRRPAAKAGDGLAGARRARRAVCGVILAGLGALVLSCFGGVLFQDRQFGFRDAGHFYYPVHLRVLQEWQAGRWPVWTPEENAGMPLLGNPTAAVLYPAKAVFFLLPYPWAARVYVIGHVLLCFVAMRAMLRGWDVSNTGAGLGALAYAFGAPVIGQTGNVIFLVGAAWAPLGFLAADRWLRLNRRKAIAGLAVVLAMQVLGGDPQSAYVTVVSAAGYAAGLAAARNPAGARRVARWGAVGLVAAYVGLLGLSWWSARGRDDPSWFPPTAALVLATWGMAAAVVMRRARGGFVPMMGGVVDASTLALAVAGAQVVPAVEFAWRSVRASETQDSYDIYRFSVHPLQVVDAIWPNAYGTVDRGNRSWIVALPGIRESQLWMPSLYLGGLTLVLAGTAAGFRDGPAWRPWLTSVAIVSLLAGFGVYASPLLWGRTVASWSAALGPIETPDIPRIRTDGFLRDGDGGVYWWLASALPAFQAFRFPAKFLVFMALAVCGMAGAGWDRIVAGRSRRAGFLAGGLLGVSLTALGASWIVGERLRDWLDGVARSVRSVYGPLDVNGAIADLRGAGPRDALQPGGHARPRAHRLATPDARRNDRRRGADARPGRGQLTSCRDGPSIRVRDDTARLEADRTGGKRQPFARDVSRPASRVLGSSRVVCARVSPTRRGDRPLGARYAPRELRDAPRDSRDVQPRHDRTI